MSLEARARAIALEALGYPKDQYISGMVAFHYPKFIKITSDILEFAAEVADETREATERRVREETIRECAKIVFAKSGFYSTEQLRIAGAFEALLPATPYQMKCQDCGKIDVLFTEKTKRHPCGPLCVECVMKRMNEFRASQETPAEENK